MNDSTDLKPKNEIEDLKTEDNIPCTSAQSQDSIASDDLRCTICLDTIKNQAKLDGCTHSFCLDCIKQWSQCSANCPMCKAPMCEITYMASGKPEKILVSNTPRNQPVVNNGALFPLTEERRALKAMIRDYTVLLNGEARCDRGNMRRQVLPESKRSKAIEQVQKLIRLKDSIASGVPRRDILMETEFRRTVYVKNMHHSFLDPTQPSIRLFPDVFKGMRSNCEALMRRWIHAEFKAIPHARSQIPYSSVADKFSELTLDNSITKIIDIAERYEMGDRDYEKRVMKMNLMSRNYAQIFVRELTFLIRSRLSIGDFCAKSSYKMPQVGTSIYPVDEVVLDDDETTPALNDSDLQVVHVGRGDLNAYRDAREITPPAARTNYHTDDDEEEDDGGGIYRNPTLRVPAFRRLFNFRYNPLLSRNFRSPVGDQSDLMRMFYPPAQNLLSTPPHLRPGFRSADETITLDDSSQEPTSSSTVASSSGASSSSNTARQSNDNSPTVTAADIEVLDDDTRGHVIPVSSRRSPFQSSVDLLRRRLQSGKQRDWKELEKQFLSMASYCKEQRHKSTQGTHN